MAWLVKSFANIMINNRDISKDKAETYCVVECSPFTVDNHFTSQFPYWCIAQFGNLFDLLDIRTIGSCTKDTT